MEISELFALIGFPARLAGRLPLFLRYTYANSNVLAPSTYSLERWGPSYRWRPWLVFDAAELEALERLMNEGADAELMDFKNSQIASGGGTAIVGSLLASACATMLTLESLSDINLVVRGMFTISLMLSMLSVYFTLIQQRELSDLNSAHRIRVWLWNGRWRVPHNHDSLDAVRESSITSRYILSAPFEILRIIIAVFLGAVIAYLALTMERRIQLGTGPGWGNRGVLIAFLVCTAFTLVIFSQALGQKDREMAMCRASEDEGKGVRQVVTTVSPKVDNS